MVYAMLDIDGTCELDTDEATCACRVGQDVGDVGRSNERGQTGKILYMLAIGTLHLDTCQLDEVLQESALHGGTYLVELVEVDEQELTHGLQHRLLLVEDQVVVISPLQLVGNERLAEGGLVVSLFRDEQRSDGIAVTIVAPQPLRHHSEEPRAEPSLPMGIGGGHSACQFSDVVATVPLSLHLPQIFLHRVVALDQVRLHKSADLPIPDIESGQACLHSETVLHTLVDGMPAILPAVQGAIFGVAHHGVAAEAVAAFQAAYDLLHDGFLRHDGFARCAPCGLVLGVCRLHDATYELLAESGFVAVFEVAPQVSHRLLLRPAAAAEFHGHARGELLVPRRPDVGVSEGLGAFFHGVP